MAVLQHSHMPYSSRLPPLPPSSPSLEELFLFLGFGTENSVFPSFHFFSSPQLSTSPRDLLLIGLSNLFTSH